MDSKIVTDAWKNAHRLKLYTSSKRDIAAFLLRRTRSAYIETLTMGRIEVCKAIAELDEAIQEVERLT